MKKQRNAILNGVASRIRQLLERYDESKAISHDTTKGSLREAYLRQFLADFVPHPFAIKSGFVTDSCGHDISPQIDLLVFDTKSIPGFNLSEFITVVPLETVRLVTEVKSRLDSSDYDQIKRQQDSIRRMRFVGCTLDRKFMGSRGCPGISQIVFAFESACSKETLQKWFDDELSLEAICVVGKFCMMRDPNTNKVESVESDAEHSEVLHLVARVHGTILRTDRALRERSAVDSGDGILHFEPDVGAYLTFDAP